MQNVLSKVNCFIQLVPVEDSAVWEDLVDSGYEDLAGCYTLAGEEDNVYIESLELDFVAKTRIVSTIGRDGGCSAYDQERTVLVAKDGTVWIAEEDFDEYFC